MSLFNRSGENPSLRASIWDGVSHAVMMGAGETYLGPFGIFLRATTLQVGLLATAPQLFDAIMQFLTARAMPRFRSRRTVIFFGILFQASCWVPIALLAFYPGTGNLSVILLTGLVCLYFGANGMVVPVWNSLIGDLVPIEIRGRYFGSRNRLTGMSTFIALFLAGIVLHIFKKNRMVEAGFFIIFMVAFLARLNSARWISRYEDPELTILPEQSFTFRQFIRRSKNSNFAKFVFYVGAIKLGVAFSAPYFALYMLRDLKFSYVAFTCVTAVMTITQFLTVRYWGELSDRFGNKKILTLCGWGVAIVPILWLFSTHILYIVLIQICAGLVWAGFILASANFIFDAVTPPKRALCVAYQGLVNGVCTFIGSIAGGLTAMALPATYTIGPAIWKPISVLPMIFVISGILRLIGSGLLLHKFKEVRPVEPIRNRELVFRVSHIKPIAGATFNLIAGIFKDSKHKVGFPCSTPGLFPVHPFMQENMLMKQIKDVLVEISDEDVLKAMAAMQGYIDITPADFKEVYRAAYSLALNRMMTSIKAENIMTRPVHVVSLDMDLIQTAAFLADKNISGAPVVDGRGKIAGVISEKDFIKNMDMGRSESFMGLIADCLRNKGCLAAPMRTKTIADIMTAPAVTGYENISIGEISSIFITRRINRLPIVDKNGIPMGIVTRSDLVGSYCLLG